MAVLLLATACLAQQRRGVRIVLITVDTLRYDSLSGGEGRATTMPLVASYAEGCLVFDSFYASTSSTAPTHATILTSRHPWQHGLTRNGQVLSEENTTLAERLRAAGFSTAAVVASVPVSRIFGFDRGFETFHDEFSHVLQPDGRGSVGGRYYSLADSVTTAALGALDDLGGSSRQFLWVHYFDPHAPYGDTADGPTVRPMPLVQRIVRGEVGRSEAILNARQLYDQDVEFMDRAIWRVLQRLSAEEESYETHVLLTADHGESFGEDGSMAHGRRLTEGQIHVPTFVCSPRVAPGRSPVVVGSVDISPTIMSLADLSGAALLGLDLANPTLVSGGAAGMKTTQAYQELRLDGKVYDLNSNLFYLVDEDSNWYRGNKDRVLEPSVKRPDSVRSQGDIARVFAGFEEQLSGASTEELLDAEIREALEALGYVSAGPARD